MEELSWRKQAIFTLIFCILMAAVFLVIMDKITIHPQRIIMGISQHVEDYIEPQSLQTLMLDKDKQNQLAHDYLSHYFSPWTGQNRFRDDNAIKSKEYDYIQQFQKDPGFGENQQKYSSAWIENIINNTNMGTFAQHEQKAIITEPSDLRVLPTMDPSFVSVKKAGQFYPFDMLQETFLSVGTPALILNTSKDGAWDLIYIHNDYGWILHQHIAYADENFIKQIQTLQYGVVTKDKTPIYSEGKFNFYGRLGSIYPLPSPSSRGALYFPVRDIHQQAVLAMGNTDETYLQAFPLVFTAKNMADLAQRLLGTPYGWGDLYGYRDCSATTMDLLAPFGIWLPRNSGQQIKMGHYISLSESNRTQKEEIIAHEGKPFLTLIGMPGHIMLYIGKSHGQIYVLQNIWGIHTGAPYLPFLGEGRAIIGKTVITPLNFDWHYVNVPTPLIDKINGMTTL